MSPLPTVPEASRADHMLFEVSGGHARAVRILVKHLGIVGALRAAAGMTRRQLGAGPFRDLPPIEPDDTGEWLTRRQLEPVLLLHAALREDLKLSPEGARAVLADLVADVGMALLARRFPPLDAEAWHKAVPGAREQVARRVFARLGNVPEADVRSGDDWLEVDVRRCRFAELCAEVGQPDLAGLFCAADSRYFDRPDSPVRLTRTQTIATGGAHCDFRFQLPAAD